MGSYVVCVCVSMCVMTYNNNLLHLRWLCKKRGRLGERKKGKKEVRKEGREGRRKEEKGGRMGGRKGRGKDGRQEGKK